MRRFWGAPLSGWFKGNPKGKQTSLRGPLKKARPARGDQQPVPPTLQGQATPPAAAANWSSSSESRSLPKPKVCSVQGNPCFSSPRTGRVGWATIAWRIWVSFFEGIPNMVAFLLVSLQKCNQRCCDRLEGRGAKCSWNVCFLFRGNGSLCLETCGWLGIPSVLEQGLAQTCRHSSFYRNKSPHGSSPLLCGPCNRQ